jgi:transcriptional regulator with XRE-family HTH domain
VTPTTDWNWKRLGDAVRARRRALRIATQADLAEKAGVHEGTIRNIERGREATSLPRKTAQIEDALGWGPGSFESVLEGGEPFLVEAASGIDPDKLVGAIEHARLGDPFSDDELHRILDADLAPQVKAALLELHRTRLAEARRQTREDLDRALRERNA